MTRKRTLRTAAVVLAAAWLMALPAFYLLYDYWMRGLDSSVGHRELLRPYAFFLGVCPLLLFWSGSVFATVAAAGAIRGQAGGSPASETHALGLAVVVIGAAGSLVGTAVGSPLLLVLLVGMGQGEVPVGLLALLGSLSAAGIWTIRYLLRRFDRAESA